MLSQEQINQAVADVVPDVLRGLREEIKERALYDAKNQALKEVNAAVTTWVKTEIIPQVHIALAESKDGLISFSTKLAGEITSAVSDSLIKSLRENLEKSWERKKIFEALIG